MYSSFDDHNILKFLRFVVLVTYLLKKCAWFYIYTQYLKLPKNEAWKALFLKY